MHPIFMQLSKFNLPHFLYFFIFLAFSYSVKVEAQQLTPSQLDSLANKAIQTFNVPGMAITIVKDGKVYYSKGYGVRSITSKKAVDENTLFGIASNSKAFTTAALGILVSEGKLKWDDKVTDYIPEFRMYDPYVTSEFTIRDLLTHRSGLGLNEGDLMHNPDSTDFTVKDIIHNLRYLKPAASFRTTYAYDNILYLVAGELIARVSGMSWGDFIEKQIMAPLQMNNSGASYVRVKHNADIIDAHREVNGKLETIIRGDEESDAGAGGIYSSAADMSKWMLMQLNDGKYGPSLNKQLFTAAVHHDMWTPQISIPIGRAGSYNTHFGAYGLGWFLVDAKGYFEVFHTGQDDGMISEVEMIPELRLGITVLTNQEGGGAVRAVIDQLTDSYLGIKGTDQIQEYVDRLKSNSQAVDTVEQKIWKRIALNQKNNLKTDTSHYTGIYHDNWFDDVNINLNKGKLWFRSKRSLQLNGQLFPYTGNTFVVKWSNPQINVDAFVLFTLDETGKATGMTMKAISPQGAPGFDFQDLDFKRVK
jgi:CubicO group peptidase (beta-lactamase class C family)